MTDNNPISNSNQQDSNNSVNPSLGESEEDQQISSSSDKSDLNDEKDNPMIQSLSKDEEIQKDTKSSNGEGR